MARQAGTGTGVSRTGLLGLPPWGCTGLSGIHAFKPPGSHHPPGSASEQTLYTRATPSPTQPSSEPQVNTSQRRTAALTCPAEGRGRGCLFWAKPHLPTAHPGLLADKELTRVTGGHVLRKCRHVLGRGGASLPGKWTPPRIRRPEGGPSRGSEGGARGGGRGPLQLLQRGSWDPAEQERRGRALRPKAFQHVLWEVL